MNLKQAATWAVVAIGGGALAYGAWEWTRSMGRDAMAAIAKERDLCKVEDCHDGIQFIRSFASDRYKLSANTVEWCLGVDKWAETKVHRGGWLKSLIVPVMYWPCGDLAG